jgi:hypothetical protein
MALQFEFPKAFPTLDNIALGQRQDHQPQSILCATEVRAMSVVLASPQQNIDKLTGRSAGANAIQDGALLFYLAGPIGS